MEFRLMYKGLLRSNGNPTDKQMIRRALHPQLKELSTVKPYPTRFLDPNSDEPNKALEDLGSFKFAPIVNQKVGVGADVDILMLRPGDPGNLIQQGGDIDNRLKTLLDALSIPPHENAIPAGDHPGGQENPLFCLLEDDSLILSLNVTTDRLLSPVTDNSEVFLVIRVVTKCIYTNPTIMGVYF